MCKADSSEILSTFEVVLPPSIVDTCHRMRPGISTCFLAVNKDEGTSSQITVAKQTDDSVVLKVSVMALGKSKREQHRPVQVKADRSRLIDEGVYESDDHQSKTSLHEMELFIQKAREHAGQFSDPHEQSSNAGPIRRKPGPAFTKKPGYVPGKSKKPQFDDSGKTNLGRNTYEKINSGKQPKKLLINEEPKSRGQRYVPSTKLHSKNDEKDKSEDSTKKQSGMSRFAKTQATLAAIEAANKKKPSYIGNLRTRLSSEVPKLPVQPVMPVLQSVSDSGESSTECRTVQTSKKTGTRGRRARPTQPYGQPRPTGMNKSLTKIWGNKKKRTSRKSNKVGAQLKSKSVTIANEVNAVTEDVATNKDNNVSNPVDIKASESTIVITVSDGQLGSSAQGTEILHHKKRWAAANTLAEDDINNAPDQNTPMSEGDNSEQDEEGEISYTESHPTVTPEEVAVSEAESHLAEDDDAETSDNDNKSVTDKDKDFLIDKAEGVEENVNGKPEDDMGDASIVPDVSEPTEQDSLTIGEPLDNSGTLIEES